MTTYKISSEDSGARLDLFLVDKLPHLSRAHIQKLNSHGKLTVSGVKVKDGYILKNSDLINVDLLQEPSRPKANVKINVLYEDSDSVVFEKPNGMLTHSKGAFNPEETVETWLVDRLQGISGPRAGIVHRLDRGTSGVMICAKNAESLKWLQKQFSQRKVKKTYLAIIDGHMKHHEAIIDMPIERNPKAPATFRVGANGKSAQTHYRVLKQNEKYSLLELSPVTGRTHQLRVHLSKQNHPIIGDIFYGGSKAERLLLHAKSLEITLPNRERKIFESKPPKIFEDYIK